MFNWFKKASEGAQRGNVRRTLSRLVKAANHCDSILVGSGSLPAADKAQVVSIQKQLLGDMIGPLSNAQLRAEFLDPLEEDSTVSEGARVAVRHVFDTATRR